MRCPWGVAGKICRSDKERIHVSTLSFGDIDTHDNEITLCHHPLPSLLGSGSKPLQLFGLRKTPELSLALFQALSLLGATGSVQATGGWGATARSHTLTAFTDTRAQGRARQHRSREIAVATRPPVLTMPRTPHLNAGPAFSGEITRRFRPDRKRSMSTQGVRSPVSSTTAVDPGHIRVPGHSLKVQACHGDVLTSNSPASSSQRYLRCVSKSSAGIGWT